MQRLLEETGRATPFQWKMNWRPTLSIRITALNLGIFGQTFFSTLRKSCLVLKKKCENSLKKARNRLHFNLNFFVKIGMSRQNAAHGRRHRYWPSKNIFTKNVV